MISSRNLATSKVSFTRRLKGPIRLLPAATRKASRLIFSAWNVTAIVERIQPVDDTTKNALFCSVTLHDRPVNRFFFARN
jgi:hypothetical protein